ncbi:kin of IRRE-like protein 3 [Lytechinus pictus]|uniref:kin of IRRE-like protein 3 n=1 Tax=Lytechinus pictus TaxID=7653 RepID=UPI0030BA0188
MNTDLGSSATQSLTQQPAETAVNSGVGSVTLHCTVASKTGQLFWIKDGEHIGSDQDVNIPGRSRYSIVGDASAGEYNLKIVDVTLADDGLYQCQVTPSATDEGLKSNTAKLTVQRPPGSVSLDGSPTMSVEVTEQVNLTCNANAANPAATIEWFRDNEPLEGAVYSSGRAANDVSGKLWDAVSELTVTPGLIDHGPLYECRASNAALTEPMTSSLTFDVQHAPVVAVETEPANVREETTTICRCVVNANPRSVSYVWTKNGETMTGVDGNQMELLVTKEDHKATIKCTATNTIGTTEGTMELNVLYGPRLVEVPASVSVDEGSPAQMLCIGDGNPTPTTKWTRLGSRATLSTMQSLQFDTVRESDVGVYVCSVTVPGFDPITTIGRLDINSVPLIDSLSIQKAKIGSTATLECSTDTKPDPYLIMWSWDDIELETGSVGRFEAEQVEASSGGIASLLHITKVQKEDYGDYNCTVWNEIGIQSKIITLEQQGMDLIIYIIIGVVSASGFIFIMTIIFMAYCRRRYRKKKVQSETTSKEAIPVEIIPQVMSLKDALNKGKKTGDEPDGSPHSSGSRPRYAMPHEFVNRRRDSWDDPQYRRRQSNEYMEPHHFDRRPPPPWEDDDNRRDPYNDDDPYARHDSHYSKFEDAEPEPIYHDRSIRSQRSRHSDHEDYVDPQDFCDPPYTRYKPEGKEYRDRDDPYDYDRESDKDSEISYDSKDRLATNV